MVGRFASRVFLSDEFGALLGLHVHLSIHPVTSFVDELEGMSTVSVHEAVAVGYTSITHEDHDLMNRLGVLRQVVPEHCAVIATAEMCGWVALLSMDKVRELGRVT